MNKLCPRTSVEAAQLTALVDERLNSLSRALDHDEDWKTWLAIGAAERALAGDHEDRYWLELAQNARDALHEGGGRRAWFGVTESGVVVANDGAPFRLWDPQVLDAVCLLGRSTKADKAGFVGHKGIGLKSIILRSAGYSVRSRSDAGEIHRVGFLRSKTWEFVQVKLAQLREKGPEGERIANCRTPDRAAIPLFRAPHVIKESIGLDCDLLEDLLEDGSPKRNAPEGLGGLGELTPLPGFRTAVHLPFGDGDWQRPASAEGDSAAEAEAWTQLMALTPEVLITLGEFAEVHLVRICGGRIIGALRFDFDREDDFAFGPAEMRYRGAVIRVAVHRFGDVGGYAESAGIQDYVEFSAPFDMPRDDGVVESSPIRALVRVPTETGSPRGLDCPLALFYPIEHAHAGLPFVLHAPFVVTPNRKELRHAPQNRTLFDHALGLLLRAAEHAAAPGSPLAPYMPWVMTPTKGPKSRSDQLEVFKESLAVELRMASCVPTAQGEAACGADLLFDAERTRAFAVLGPRLPALRVSPLCLSAFDRLVEAEGQLAVARAKMVGLGSLLADPRRALGIADQLAKAFAETEGMTITVDPDAARAWVRTIAVWIRACEAQAPSVADALGRGRVPLIPAARDVGEGTRLVRLEVQARTQAGTQFLRRARVLLWRNRDDKEDISVLPPPPPSLPVYLADEQLANDEFVVAMLTQYGKRWGATRLERARTLAEEVADRLADTAPECTELVGYLAALVDLLPPGAWPAVPYAGIDPQRIHRAVSDASSRDDLLFARRLGRVSLPTSAGGWAGGDELAFGADWAPAIDRLELIGSDKGALSTGVRWGKAVRSMAVARGFVRSPAPLVAGPDDTAWLPALAMLARLGTAAPHRALARLLVSLGVAPGPVVQLRWAHWSENAGEIPGAVAVDVARGWSAGRVTGLPAALEFSLLEWRQMAWSSHHHPSLTTWHSPACPAGAAAQRRPPTSNTASEYPVALTWIWSAELLDIDVDDAAAAESIRSVLADLLPELEPLLSTSWACRGHHGVGDQFQAIPSLLRVQLAEARMWPGTTRHGAAPTPTAARELVYANESLADAATSQTGWLPRLHSPENGIDPMRPLASALGILPVNELPTYKAWSLLSHHIENSMSTVPAADATVVDLPHLSGRTQWVGAANLLLRRLLDAMAGVSDGVRFAWCARDLALRPGWMLATRGDVYVAIRVSAGPGSQAATLRTAVSNYREQPPAALVRDALVMVVDRADRPRFATLLAALGAPETAQPSAPPFAGRLDESQSSEALVCQLRAILTSRLPELIGVLALHRGDPSADARLLLDRIARLRIHCDAGLRPPSGLTLGDHPGLVASREALDAAEKSGRPLAATLARGVAFAVNAPTYEHSFRWALTEEVEEVRATLREQDVRVEELIASVAELSAAKAARSQELGAAFDLIMPQGLTVDLALREDLIAGLNGLPAKVRWLRAVLAVGAAASMDLAERLRTYRGPFLPTTGVLNDLVCAGETACSRALVRLAALAVLSRLVTEAGPMPTPANASTVFRDELNQLLRIDWWEPFGAMRASSDDVVVEGPHGSAVTWSEQEWGTLTGSTLCIIESLWAKAGRPSWLRALVEDVLDPVALQDALTVAGRDVKNQSANRETAWLTSMLARSSSEAIASSGELLGSKPDATGRGGSGGGGGGDPVRGQAAELACLRWLWQRFVALPAAERSRLMTAVVERREAEGVAWSTNAGAVRARKLERQHAAALARASLTDILSLIEPFRAIFDVSTERGPGFDLIEWHGEPGTPGWPILKRVEIKAVETAASLTFRITTNEFHRARIDGQSYFLRLVEVPDADQPIATVVREVRDPVATLKMEQILVDCVRSGEANFRLT